MDVPRGGNLSGWSSFAGTESQGYADEPSNFAIYDINRSRTTTQRSFPSWTRPTAPPSSVWLALTSSHLSTAGRLGAPGSRPNLRYHRRIQRTHAWRHVRVSQNIASGVRRDRPDRDVQTRKRYRLTRTTLARGMRRDQMKPRTSTESSSRRIPARKALTTKYAGSPMSKAVTMTAPAGIPKWICDAAAPATTPPGISEPQRLIQCWRSITVHCGGSPAGPPQGSQDATFGLWTARSSS